MRLSIPVRAVADRLDKFLRMIRFLQKSCRLPESEGGSFRIQAVAADVNYLQSRFERVQLFRQLRVSGGV